MGLEELVAGGDVVVLSGAGISTDSGIPDYRGRTGRARPASPMTYQVFTGSAEARQRYWARSHLGWRHVARAEPNAGHVAVTTLQAQGLVSGVVTQNVDRLHTAAGTQDVLELHGALDRVVCLRCGEITSREGLDDRLHEANPAFTRESAPLKPDGDVDLDDVRGFTVVDCLVCGGLLKPDVVFFGETVPRARVDRALALVDAARSLLVLGSSLTVMSGYRFVLHAARRGIPVAIVCEGPTRGDAQAAVKVDASLSQVLPRLAEGRLASA
ncbi:MAG TPA: NAD-dependent protein deacetylase [Mycobacteriales bacterium]|nr:NAD-dependent protein deacetylase [Mycobacteriales bacterium]